MKKFEVTVETPKSGKVKHVVRCESVGEAKVKIDIAYNGACKFLGHKEVHA